MTSITAIFIIPRSTYCHTNTISGQSAPNTNIGGFADAFYWSSTQLSSDFANSQHGITGVQVQSLKFDGSLYVRAIRTF